MSKTFVTYFCYRSLLGTLTLTLIFTGCFLLPSKEDHLSGSSDSFSSYDDQCEFQCGATNSATEGTLKCRPKLAICVNHHLDDACEGYSDEPVMLPDDGFKTCITSKIQEPLTHKLACKIQVISCSGGNIAQVPSLSPFIHLRELRFSKSPLTQLTLDSPALEELQLSEGQLQELDTTHAPVLKKLIIYENRLQHLDLSLNPLLTYVDAFGNQLSNVNMTHLTSLDFLNFSGNQLTTIDLSSLTQLRMLILDVNPLTTLDLSHLSQLKELWAIQNKLTRVVFVENHLLERVILSSNELETLDLNGVPKLHWLVADSNKLTEVMGLEGKTLLNEVILNNNQLKTIGTIENLIYLQRLELENNPAFDCASLHLEKKPATLVVTTGCP